MRLGIEPLERRDTPSVGGGFTDHGLDGVYYADPNFTTPSFSRRDVRLDFDWGTTVKPGGSISPGFRDLGTDNFSARWTGQLVPRFSEPYTFSGFADDRFKLELRPAGAAGWTTVVDQTAFTGTAFLGTAALRAGQTYDVRVSYQEFGGAAAVRLSWASPSTPREVVEPLDHAGFNNPDGPTAFADIVKGARNSWEGLDGNPSPALDADGWPTGDAGYYFQESLNQGLGLDPLMRGRVAFQFTGKATVSLFGNVNPSSLAYGYDPATNTTAGSFVTRDNNINASMVRLRNTTRTGQPGGPGGVTHFKLLRPTAPDATTTYTPDAVFTTAMKDYARHYTVVRHQYVANQQREWADRTKPSFFNQSGGSRTAPTYPLGWDSTSDNGWSWEHKVMFANETGTDLMISLPPLTTGRTAADTGSYLFKLANLLRHGSDGAEPYTAPTANPVYPPLNPNLRVYLEIGNELWNWASVFYVDYRNIDEQVRAVLTTNSPDFAAINYDGLSVIPDSSGNYTNMGEWRYRFMALRLAQIGDVFRGVYGAAAMPDGGPDARVRPMYEWQYANSNDTARKALTWADRYFNKADPASTYPGPARPVNSILWGGGGATYYGANNGNGLTDLLADSSFETPVVPAGYTQAPAGAAWIFAGTAGLARDGGAGDDIPTPFAGGQVGYVAGTGRLMTTFTVPAAHTSDVYAVSFKAYNRKKVGASSADAQTLRVYLDYGTPNQIDLTARTYSQWNGYTPPSSDQLGGWLARNVSWTNSQYYYTKSVALAAGSVHTVTIVGTKAADQAAFLEDVRVTSVDAIFAGGIPGGGEATGQPAGQNVRTSMNTAVSWAAAYGLRHIAYEGGWSLGGDDGGSAVQLKAKYGDPRTATAQATFMDYYDEAGGAVNVFGTYAQLPSWADSYAEQGLLDAGRYPIIQGIDRRADRLGAVPTNGTPVPAVLTRTAVTLGDRAETGTARITAAGGWLSWNVLVPRTGTYRVQTVTQAGGAVVVLADEALVASGTSGGELAGTVFLTYGLHAFKVRSTAAGPVVVTSLSVSGVGAPAAPVLTGLTARNDVATLTWGVVPGAGGYVLLSGTEPGRYTSRTDVGGVTATTVEGLTSGTTYYFAVAAYGPDRAESLPSAGRAVTALIAGQLGSLARWEFTGLVAGGATAPATAEGIPAAGVTVGPLTRGAGLTPAAGWVTQHYPDRFGSGAVGNTWATTLTDAVTRNQYYQFALATHAGVRLALDELRLQVWFSDAANANNRVAVRYSTDGSTFADLPFTGSFNSATGLTVPLQGVAALQNPAGSVTFRVYTYGSAAYSATGIGLGTPADDLVVRGRVRAVPAVEAVVVNDGSAQRSMVNRMTVTFDALVTLGANPFSVRPATGGAVVPVTWTLADVGGRTVATLSFPGGSVTDGRWRLTVVAGEVTHRVGGAAMATNSVSDFHRLFGDGNGDATTDGNDYLEFVNGFGLSGTDLGFTPGYDANTDGVVDGFDYLELVNRFGVSV